MGKKECNDFPKDIEQWLKLKAGPLGYVLSVWAIRWAARQDSPEMLLASRLLGNTREEWAASPGRSTHPSASWLPLPAA